MPIPNDIGKAYATYFTHQRSTESDMIRNLYERLKRAYRSYRYSFPAFGISRVEQVIARAVHFMLVARRDDFQFGFEQLAGLSKGRLLEVGCGSGEMLRLFTEGGWQAEGVDFDPLAVKQAVKKGLHVHVGDIFSRRYVDNAFDAIFTSHVVEHVPDPEAFLRECKRILRTGGLLVIFTPNAKSYLHSVFKECWLGLDPPRHLHVFTPQAINLVARRAGFTMCRVHTSVHGASGIFLASRKIKAQRNFTIQGKNLLLERLTAEIAFWREWKHVKSGRATGEEIIFLATKT